MSKQKETDETCSKELADLKYEIRTQTGLIVVLVLLNLATLGFCLLSVYNHLM